MLVKNKVKKVFLNAFQASLDLFKYKSLKNIYITLEIFCEKSIPCFKTTTVIWFVKIVTGQKQMYPLKYEVLWCKQYVSRTILELLFYFITILKYEELYWKLGEVV